MAYIGAQPRLGNFQACDAISATATATFNLLVGGTAIFPQSAQHCLVSLNGVLQAPISSYTISGSTIIFAAALTTDDSIDFITILGDTLDLGVPSDDTVGAAQIKADLISGTTALTSAPDDTDELLISDAGTLKRIDVSLVGGKNTPAFLAVPNATQAIANATYVKLVFGSETYDVGTCFASSRFTVPTGGAGKYFIAANTGINGIDDGEELAILLYKNGSSVENFKRQFYGVKSDTTLMMGTVGVFNLSETDYIEVFVRHTEGGSQNLRIENTFFQGFKSIE